MIRRYTLLGEDATAAAVADKVVEEVQGNLEYILHERSSERAYRNGTRDLSRAFAQFCERNAADADRAAMRRHPCFFLEPESELYRRYRPAWDALPPAEQQLELTTN